MWILTQGSVQRLAARRRLAVDRARRKPRFAPTQPPNGLDIWHQLITINLYSFTVHNGRKCRPCGGRTTWRRANFESGFKNSKLNPPSLSEHSRVRLGPHYLDYNELGAKKINFQRL